MTPWLFSSVRRALWLSSEMYPSNSSHAEQCSKHLCDLSSLVLLMVLCWLRVRLRFELRPAVKASCQVSEDMGWLTMASTECQRPLAHLLSSLCQEVVTGSPGSPSVAGHTPAQEASEQAHFLLAFQLSQGFPGFLWHRSAIPSLCTTIRFDLTKAGSTYPRLVVGVAPPVGP
jgi:hypothetical protein